MLKIQSVLGFTLLLLGGIIKSDHTLDKLIYLDPATLVDKDFKVVWAFDSMVEDGDVNLKFSNENESYSFEMSGNCDFSGSYSFGEGSSMDWNWSGEYSSCSSARVKDTLDHWRNNRDVNQAQQYLLYATAFGSSWVMMGDKDHASNSIRTLIGQHVMSHPKFLNEEYAIHSQNYPSST